jgi:hypothetical protein
MSAPVLDTEEKNKLRAFAREEWQRHLYMPREYRYSADGFAAPYGKVMSAVEGNIIDLADLEKQSRAYGLDSGMFLDWSYVGIPTTLLSPYQVLLLARQVRCYRRSLLKMWSSVGTGIEKGSITTTEQISRCFLAKRAAEAA